MQRRIYGGADSKSHETVFRKCNNVVNVCPLITCYRYEFCDYIKTGTLCSIAAKENESRKGTNGEH
jgi:hypothetical protein